MSIYQKRYIIFKDEINNRRVKKNARIAKVFNKRGTDSP